MDKIEREDLINAGYMPETATQYYDGNTKTREVENGVFTNKNYEPIPRIVTIEDGYQGQIEALRWKLLTRADLESFTTKKVPTFCDTIQ